MFFVFFFFSFSVFHFLDDLASVTSDELADSKNISPKHAELLQTCLNKLNPLARNNTVSGKGNTKISATVFCKQCCRRRTGQLGREIKIVNVARTEVIKTWTIEDDNSANFI